MHDDVKMGPTGGDTETGGAVALDRSPGRGDGDDLVEKEELVEEILIDGICGVY